MGRILSIDYGRKRVGLAVTDVSKIIANRLETVGSHDIWTFLKSYFEKESVEKVIVGYPMQLNNQPSGAVLYVNQFIKQFRKLYPEMDIEQVDERFTSKMAMQAMIDGGLNKEKRKDKALVDGISAVIILNDYLEKLRYRK
jgi:putative Holliday junction resolvase